VVIASRTGSATLMLRVPPRPEGRTT